MAHFTTVFFFSFGFFLSLQLIGVLGQAKSRNEAHFLESEQASNQDLDPDLELRSLQNTTEDNSVSDREARLWTLFRRTSTANTNCVSSGGRQGTCRSRKSCEKSNGVVISNSCGNKGTNVCCLARARCSATNSERPIRINSTGTHMYPPTMYSSPIQCRFDIPRRNGVCQVRLDFITFEMAQPSSDPASSGDCVDDALTITGADNLRNFQICGNNRGQHLYLHYGSSNMITLTTRLRSLVTPAVYDILATFINCNEDGNRVVAKTKGRSGRRFTNNNNNDDDDPDMDNMNMNTNAVMPVTSEAAPVGCTQYFTRSSGTVMSFNYAAFTVAGAAAGGVGAGNVAANQVEYQLNNQRYTVCVRSNPGTTEITWQTCPNGAFVVSGALPSLGPPPTQPQGCPTDYIDIPGGSRGARYCGSNFPGPVTSTMKPFTLGVNFDAVEILGPNFETNPATGCCIFCECIDGNGLPVAGMCSAPNSCELNENLMNRVDFNNIGFCLTYTVS